MIDIKGFLLSQDFQEKEPGVFKLIFSEDEGGSKFIAIVLENQPLVAVGAKSDNGSDLMFLSLNLQVKKFKELFKKFVYRYI